MTRGACYQRLLAPRAAAFHARHFRFALSAAVTALLLAFSAYAAPLPAGPGRITVDAGGTPIEVYTYKPQGYAGGGLLLTLHGFARNAAGYRVYAKALAERHDFLVVAPLFDRGRFPIWRYQWGGVVRTANQPATGTLQPEPEDQWTGGLLLKIVDAIRALEMTPDLPYYLLGHSAGGQALSRIAGLMPTGARRIVIANPGTYLWPTRESRFPDGFGGLPERWSDDEAIRRYLAQPVTLLLGTADLKQDADLSMRESAVAQGANRYERGSNVYRSAQKLAKDRGWEFNWRLIEVPGVGHSASRMFRSEQAIAALAP